MQVMLKGEIAWNLIEKKLNFKKLKLIKSEKNISDINDLSKKILKGKIKGRTLISFKKIIEYAMKINSNDFKDITGFLRDISKKASNKILDIYNHSFDVKKN